MAAIKGFPEAQTWILGFPILTAASEQSPDSQINQKEYSHQAGRGQKQWDGLPLTLTASTCQTGVVKQPVNGKKESTHEA